MKDKLYKTHAAKSLSKGLRIELRALCERYEEGDQVVDSITYEERRKIDCTLCVERLP